MRTRDKAKILPTYIGYQAERRERREAAVASGGDEYGVEFSISPSQLDEARQAALKYQDLQGADGVVGALKRRLLLGRVEGRLAFMLHQEITVNQGVAEVDIESGLYEPYDLADKHDRRILAQIAMQRALEVIPEEHDISQE